MKRIDVYKRGASSRRICVKCFFPWLLDIRVIVIKLVDRLHNMRTLQYVNIDSQITKKHVKHLKYTRPWHQLGGMTKIKWELEDLCFKYLEPEAYNNLVTRGRLHWRRDQQEAYIKKVLDAIRCSR